MTPDERLKHQVAIVEALSPPAELVRETPSELNRTSSVSRETLLAAVDAEVNARNIQLYDYEIGAVVDRVLGLLADDAERLGAHAVRLFPEQSLALIRYADRLRGLRGQP